MDISFSVSAHDAGILQVGVSGDRLEITGFTSGRKVTVEGGFGDVTVRLVPAVAVPLQEMPTVESLVEAQPETQEHSQTEAHAETSTETHAETTSEASTETPTETPTETLAEILPEIPTEIPPETHTQASSTGQPQTPLFQTLSALRKQIASEAKLPPYIISHDATLRDMCSILPTDLQTMSRVQGMGKAKIEKYGTRFVEVIRQYVQIHSATEGAA